MFLGSIVLGFISLLFYFVREALVTFADPIFLFYQINLLNYLAIIMFVLAFLGMSSGFMGIKKAMNPITNIIGLILCIACLVLWGRPFIAAITNIIQHTHYYLMAI